MHESQHCPQPIRPSSVAGWSSLVGGLQVGTCRAVSKQRSKAVRQVAAAPRLLLLLGLLSALTHRWCALQDIVCRISSDCAAVCKMDPALPSKQGI